MKIFAVTGTPDVAEVFMADMGEGRMIEFVEALQPPYSRDERWILMISTLYGCPVKCLICDAGGGYRGKPTAEEILRQIDHMVFRWYPDGCVPACKFKIQFARMGEPALNMAVLDVLEQLPERYDAPGLMPSISTIAPHGSDEFFDGLLEVKDRLYRGGRFQFQYSIHWRCVIGLSQCVNGLLARWQFMENDFIAVMTAKSHSILRWLRGCRLSRM